MKQQQGSFVLLGLSAAATVSDVKKAYRRLVATWHPDQYAQDPPRQRAAQEKLKEINAAYADCLERLKHKGSTSVLQSPTSQRRSAARSKAASPPPLTEEPQLQVSAAPLPIWPNLFLALVLVIGWSTGLQRYGFTTDFLQFVGLFCLVPGVAAVWYNAGLLRGNVMLMVYVVTIIGAGLFLVVNQAMYEQRLLASVPVWNSGDTGAGRAAVGSGYRPGVFSAAPPPAERLYGPTAPQIVEPLAPQVPAAPLAPLMPAAPQAK